MYVYLLIGKSSCQRVLLDLADEVLCGSTVYGLDKMFYLYVAHLNAAPQAWRLQNISSVFGDNVIIYVKSPTDKKFEFVQICGQKLLKVCHRVVYWDLWCLMYL